jgi:hypothetical protein
VLSQNLEGVGVNNTGMWFASGRGHKGCWRFTCRFLIWRCFGQVYRPFRDKNVANGLRRFRLTVDFKILILIFFLEYL